MILCTIAGGLLLVGALHLLRRHHQGYAGCGGRWAAQRCHGWARFGHGYGHRADTHGPSHGPTGGWTPHWLLDRMLDRLQASPSQSREITRAFDEFAEEVKDLRGEGRRTRDDIAKALRHHVFDEVLLGELYARHDDVLLKGRKAFVGLMARVHAVLEDEQRERLAAFIDKGPRFWREGGW